MQIEFMSAKKDVIKACFAAKEIENNILWYHSIIRSEYSQKGD
jgi:hypothetical protein